MFSYIMGDDFLEFDEFIKNNYSLDRSMDIIKFNDKISFFYHKPKAYNSIQKKCYEYNQRAKEEICVHRYLNYQIFLNNQIPIVIYKNNDILEVFSLSIGKEYHHKNIINKFKNKFSDLAFSQ